MKPFLYPFLMGVLFLFACKQNNNTTEDTSPTNNTPQPTTTNTEQQVPPLAPTSDLAAKAQKMGKASASTAQNLSTGYWHVGGAVNTTEGNRAYQDEWFEFGKDQSFVFGKQTETLAKGAWAYDETNEYITFLSDQPSDDAFYLHEFKCRQMGDIILLLGNTPNNPHGMQIKLVRQDTKVIEHNPN